MDEINHAAQTPKQIKSFDHVLGHRYTISDGLAGMHVEDIYQDRQGLLWIATADGGVSRFDGEHFDTFGLGEGLPHLTVMTVTEDADGRLLFGTLGGGLAILGPCGFQVYTIEHGLPCNDILSLQLQTDGSIQVLTGTGIGWFVGDRCVERTTTIGDQPIGRVYDVATDSAGTTWLATLHRGVISLDGQCMDTDFGATNGTRRWPWKFAQDAAGRLWIAFHYIGSEAVIGRYDPQHQQFDLIDMGSELEDGEMVRHGIRDVRLDKRGWLWVARRGVLMYDGEDWHPFSARLSGAHFADTRLTYEDREGNIWVGLWGDGLVFCDSVSTQLYSEADGLPDREVRCLDEDREGRIWIGTAGGLACLEDDQIRPVATGHAVSALVVDRQGQLWSGGPDGQVFKWEGTTPRAIAVAEADHHEDITGLCQDQIGRIRVCTSQGRFGWIEADRFTAFEERLPHPCRTVLQDRDGVFWIGTHGKRPALYRHTDGLFLESELTKLETVSYVNALYENEGTLWVGTANGLFAFDYHSQQVRWFTMDQGGLSANGILSLEVDQQGRIWIGTSGGGVLNYDGRTFQCVRLGRSLHVNTVEAILCDSRGRLWFGTRAGLIAYQPSQTPPGIVIRQAVGKCILEAPQAVSCSESTPEIQIHFQGIRFRGEAGTMRYRHRLVGHAPAAEWSAFTSDNKVSYRDVPAGEFRFEVRVLDRDGLLSDIASLDVRVVSNEQNKSRVLGARLLGQSQAIVRLLEKVGQVAETNMTVLVLGETGVGKGLLTRMIHDLNQRREQAFIQVNCGAIPAGLIESELFGYEKGAFTGAVARKIGCFERAHGGTLFLDEIGDLPLDAQRTLLHILEEDCLTRVGGGVSVPIDVRVVAATNRDLKKAIQEGTFREDLFYRLSVFPLVLPPLRDHREDIPILAAHFVAQFAEELQRPVPSLGDEVIAHLQAHFWPGNVRELKHLIQRAVVVCQGGVIQVEDVPLSAEDEDEEGSPLLTASAPPVEQGAGDKDEKRQIVEALQVTNWVIYGDRGAARLLGVNPERLRSRMRVYGLRRPKKSW